MEGKSVIVMHVTRKDTLIIKKKITKEQEKDKSKRTMMDRLEIVLHK